MSDHYVYRLIPPRPTFHLDMNEEERGIMGRHAEYWGALMQKGNVVVYGPVIEDGHSWGLGVVCCETEEEMRGLIADDPAVASGMASFGLGRMAAAMVRE